MNLKERPNPLGGVYHAGTSKVYLLSETEKKQNRNRVNRVWLDSTTTNKACRDAHTRGLAFGCGECD